MLSNVTPYPSNQLHRSGYFKTMFDTTLLPYNKMYNKEHKKTYNKRYDKRYNKTYIQRYKKVQ